MYFYYKCPQCDMEAPIRQSDKHFSAGEPYVCTHCHTSFTINDDASIVKPHPDAQHIVDTYRDRLWYHVSLSHPYYFTTGDRSVITHAGTPVTCYDYYANNNYVNTKYLRVYVLRLHSDFTLRDGDVVNDVNNWYDYEQNIISGKYDGLLYINRFEAPGSISMLTHSGAYEVMDVLPFSELRYMVTHDDMKLINAA